MSVITLDEGQTSFSAYGRTISWTSMKPLFAIDGIVHFEGGDWFDMKLCNGVHVKQGTLKARFSCTVRGRDGESHEYSTYDSTPRGAHPGSEQPEASSGLTRLFRR